MILILYWYKENSKINVVLEIIQTKCKPGELSPVSIEEMCSFLHKTKCNSFLDTITQLSPINIIFDGAFTLYFSILENSCVVLQINKFSSHYSLTSLWTLLFGLRLTPNPVINSQWEIKYQTVGTLRPQLYNWERKEHISTCFTTSEKVKPECNCVKGIQLSS